MRAESLVIFFHLTFEKKMWLTLNSEKGGHENMGLFIQYSPSFRAELLREFRREKARGNFSHVKDNKHFLQFFPCIEADIAVLFELILPLGTSWQILDETVAMQDQRKKVTGTYQAI